MSPLWRVPRTADCQPSPTSGCQKSTSAAATLPDITSTTCNRFYNPPPCGARCTRMNAILADFLQKVGWPLCRPLPWAQHPLPCLPRVLRSQALA